MHLSWLPKIGIFKIILLLFSDAAPQFEIVVYGQGGRSAGRSGENDNVKSVLFLNQFYGFKVMKLSGGVPKSQPRWFGRTTPHDCVP